MQFLQTTLLHLVVTLLGGTVTASLLPPPCPRHRRDLRLPPTLSLAGVSNYCATTGDICYYVFPNGTVYEPPCCLGHQCTDYVFDVFYDFLGTRCM
ncbi:hypothetical protein C8J57DRAFT_1492785 [Mycena rebaudengoi]|nr:hypothetical protein C8J57DRAFT_1492785 [Mycena rebaudengoi]